MTCSLANGDPVTCVGSQSTKTVLVSDLFSAATDSSFSFKVNGILSPPFPTSTDKITVATKSGSYNIDTCLSSVTGLQSNTLTPMITSLTTMTINKPIELNFRVIVGETTTNTRNSYSVIFPSGSSFTSTVYITSSLGYAAVTPSGNSVSFSLLPSPYQINAGNNISFYLANFTMPPSTAPISITVNVIDSGVVVQTGSATITPVSTALSFSVDNSPKVVFT